MMGALIRALTNNAVENIEEALGMTDATSSAMKHAIADGSGTAVPRSDGHSGRRKARQAHKEGGGQGVNP